MRTRSIGSLSVSLVGLGCNQFGRKIDAAETEKVVHAALDAGINFLDTSDRYGYGPYSYSGHGRSEEFIGKALRGRREKVVVATKFGNPMGDDPRNRGGNRRWVMMAVEDSLRRLQTDYIDLYQIHRPDPETPVGVTIEALNELIQQGKVREIGCSNFSDQQLREAVAAAGPAQRGFASVQNEYSLLHRAGAAAVLAACRDNGIAFLPYFPLAGGLLTGKYRSGRDAPEHTRLALFAPGRDHLGLTEENLAVVEQLSAFAAQRGHTLLELAFAWLLAHEEISSVIAGATDPAQVTQNVRAMEWTLTPEEFAEVSRLAGER